MYTKTHNMPQYSRVLHVCTSEYKSQVNYLMCLNMNMNRISELASKGDERKLSALQLIYQVENLCRHCTFVYSIHT